MLEIFVFLFFLFTITNKWIFNIERNREKELLIYDKYALNDVLFVLYKLKPYIIELSTVLEKLVINHF